jgi:hypothetical protein
MTLQIPCFLCAVSFPEDFANQALAPMGGQFLYVPSMFDARWLPHHQLQY